MNVCVDVYFKNCWLLMLTNEYEYDNFVEKSIFMKSSNVCSLTSYHSWWWIQFKMDFCCSISCSFNICCSNGSFLLVLISLYFLLHLFVLRRWCFKWLEVDRFYCSYFVCSRTARFSCCYYLFFNVWDGYNSDLHQRII